METHHRSEWSPALGRSMEFITHGHAGLPAVVFPCMGGRPWDYADFGMIDVLRPWLDAGRLRLFCVDSIDNETFNSDGWDKRARAALQDRYHHYIADDLVPRIHDETGWGDRLLTTGNSLGGLHAAISLFRRPDLFGTMIALSGVYDAGHFFGDYSDEFVYNNSPADFVAGMPDDHPWLDAHRSCLIISGIGQGAWEEELLPSNHRMDDVLRAKGVPAWFDFWGTDMPHDWPTWHQMAPYFMERVLPW